MAGDQLPRLSPTTDHIAFISAVLVLVGLLGSTFRKVRRGVVRIGRLVIRMVRRRRHLNELAEKSDQILTMLEEVRDNTNGSMTDRFDDLKKTMVEGFTSLGSRVTKLEER